MSRCRACDAPIIWADRAVEGGGRIALDSHEQHGGKFRLEHGVAVEVVPSTTRQAFMEHNCGMVVAEPG